MVLGQKGRGAPVAAIALFAQVLALIPAQQLARERVAVVVLVVFLVAVVGAQDDPLSDAPGEDGVVDELGEIRDESGQAVPFAEDETSRRPSCSTRIRTRN